MNPHEVQTLVRLDGIELAEDVRVTDMWSGQSQTMRAGNVVISLPRCSGNAWRIGSC